MWRPEYLGKEGNILLKLIEEPPAQTFMIFVAEQTEDILATIRSRTQEVRLVPISPDEIAHALITRSNIDERQATQVANIAQGSYTEALRLSRQAGNDLYPEVRQLFQSLFKNNGIGMAKFAEDWAKVGREQQKNFLHYIIQLLEQVIRVRYLPQGKVNLPEGEAQFVQFLASSNISLDGFAEMVNVIGDTIFHIERNAHGRTQLHAMAIQMQHVIRKGATAAE
jgi:DNA polymerase-3 subunit delta'